MTNLEPLWRILSLGACLGHYIGASANLVVAQLAAKEGHPISFLKYLIISFPLMIISIVISTVYVYITSLL